MSEQGREDKLPWTKWSWSDFESDIGLRSCSLEAMGLWWKMLSIMARSERKGYLLDGEKQMESKTLAKLVGETPEKIDHLLDELFSHGVPSKDESGIIYNRRMVRESSLSSVRSEAGRLGGRPRKQTESKTESKTKARSASASASSSVSSSEGGSGGEDSDSADDEEPRWGRPVRSDPVPEPKIELVSGDGPARWSGISEVDRAEWAQNFPGLDIEIVLAEMLTYWVAQPVTVRNWRGVIERRLGLLRDRPQLLRSLVKPSEAKIQKERAVGSSRPTYEEQLTPEALKSLSLIDAEFEKIIDAEADITKIPLRNDYRDFRFAQIYGVPRELRIQKFIERPIESQFPVGDYRAALAAIVATSIRHGGTQ